MTVRLVGPTERARPEYQPITPCWECGTHLSDAKYSVVLIGPAVMHLHVPCATWLARGINRAVHQRLWDDIAAQEQEVGA